MVHRKVYKCDYQGKTRVIKRVRISAGYSKKTVESEVSILMKVSHKRIVKMIFFFTTSTHWNLVLEYMEKGSLTDMIKKRQNKAMTQSTLLTLFMDIAVAVKFLHSKGITHRDLKPENVLVSSSNRLKVADFGLSKTRPSNSLAFQTPLGTIDYMAPEVRWQKPYNNSVDSELETVENLAKV